MNIYSVHFVAAMVTGEARGNNKTGINTSLIPACNVSPEIRQPIATIAPEPKKRTIPNKENEKSIFCIKISYS